MRLRFEVVSGFFLILFIYSPSLVYTQVPGIPKNTTISKASLEIKVHTYDFELDTKTKRDLELGLANIYT
ncbi:MAG: hypothetical protein AAF984_07865, partial [Verrucomicrobiota bacterium]